MHIQYECQHERQQIFVAKMTAGLIKANILVSVCISIHVNLTFPKYIHCSFIRWADLTGVRLHICCAFLKGPISISNGKAVISPGLFCGTQTEFEWCIIVVNIARWIHHNTLVCSGKHKMQGAKGRSDLKIKLLFLCKECLENLQSVRSGFQDSAKYS